LSECKSKIEKACSYTVSKADNDTIQACKAKAIKLRSDLLQCTIKSSEEAGCTCVNAITTTSAEMTTCRDKTLPASKDAIGNRTACINAFRACKMAQDDSVDGVGTCKKVNKCGGATNKTEAERKLKILKPLQAALVKTGAKVSDALKKAGLDEGKGSDGAGFDGKSRVSRLSQLRMARYDGREDERQSNGSKDGKGCTDIFNELKTFNTSADKAVPGVGDDVDEKETTNTITSLNKLSNNPNLVTDLGSCAKESSRQDVTVTIVKIRFYIYWMGFWHMTVVQVKIITLEITFGSTPSPPPSPVVTAAPGDTDTTTKKDTDATTKKDTDATTQRGTFSPQMTTKKVSPSRTFKPPVAGPSTGTRCPARILINKCKIKCGTVTCSDGLGSDIETGSTTDVAVGGIALATETTTWKVPEGPDGASCVLSCPKENNLKETTKCSKNAEGKMEWSLPEKLKAKCEASPAASSAPSPTPPAVLPQPSTERTCPSTSLIKDCKITCKEAVCTGSISGNNGQQNNFVNGVSTTTWNLGKGEEGAACTLDCPKENLKETSKCSLNAVTKKMEWTMPEKLKAKCVG